MPVPPPVLPVPEPPEPQANTNHHHKSSRSKTRHHKSSSHPTSGTSAGGTGTSVSNLILYTTTRLSEETARANAAERQMGESLAIVRNAVKEREEVKMRLGTVQEELRMYKRELEVAQQEILRAQEVLAKVERERLDAENRATRDRAKLRKLLEEKAIRKAIEEGRRMGFEQGLETGRQMAWEDEEWYRRGRTRRRPNWTTEEETSGEYPRWSPTATATSVGNHASTSKATTAQIGYASRFREGL
ncbi:hypothetical protein BDN72DRAFT_776185 [Pluteus cervinus]|uniref:Uncharacterized protein n=1 Tax=Pluteus cervinus TaxID=181527 RepID=A0ACD3ACZ6_9AGAR|nr:hypothetical protein BDN72DRAFT_776185 [Pluteus cervinus]